MSKPKNLRFDNERGTSVPYENASPQLISRLRAIGLEVVESPVRRCCRFCEYDNACNESTGCAAVNKAILILEGKA